MNIDHLCTEHSKYHEYKYDGYNQCSDVTAHFLINTGGVGEVMGVNTDLARMGDVISLVSPPFTLDDTGCLQLEYQITEMETLDINYKLKDTSIYKYHLCTIQV